MPAHPFNDPASAASPWVGVPMFLVAIAVSLAAQRRIERVTLSQSARAA